MGSGTQDGLSGSLQQIPDFFRSVLKLVQPLKAPAECPGIISHCVNGLICVSLCGLRAWLSLSAVFALIADQE